ncbi:MAG: hypothetical protein IJ934_03075 [Acetobacter sp.]|nr:hypothetical protein [Acetobacter sp.]
MLTVEQVISLEQMSVLVAEERRRLCFSILLYLIKHEAINKDKVPDHMYDALKELVTPLLNKKIVRAKNNINFFR